MEKRTPFVIFGLPRSRTYWLSRYLSCGDWVCGHDEARHVRSIEDVCSWFSQEGVGSVETAAAPFWRLVPPGVRLAVIRRPVEDVVNSLMATGIVFNKNKLTTRMRHLDRKLDQIEGSGAMSVQFADLSSESVCARLFEHCLGLPHDPAWWARLAPINLQINLAAELRYAAAHGPQLRRAEALCAGEIRRRLRPAKVRPGPVDANGVSIQAEKLETFIRDGEHLFAEHCLAVGEPEDEWTRKNIPMIERLEDAGGWLFMTARCNGRMLGYLQTLVGPSLEAVGRVSGTQGLFFVSRDAKGMNLGMKLQRATIETLKARGTYEIMMRAGVRGSGPDLGVMYRRLGAEEFGHLYKLKLKAA